MASNKTKLTMVVDEVRPLAGYKMTLGDIVMNMTTTPDGQVAEVRYENGAENLDLLSELSTKSWTKIIRMDDEAFDKYIQTETAVRKFVRKTNKY